MKEQEASVNSITEQKAKIRLRYQGIDPNLLVVLPAKTEHITQLISSFKEEEDV